MVLPDSARVPRVPAYSGSTSARLLAFRIRDSHPLRSYVPAPFRYASVRLSMRPHNPRPGHPARVWALPLSLAATLGISIDFFSSRYLDVSVPWVGSLSKGDGIAPAGFPHSDTPGSMLACSSPRLFAACHVLRRRSVPRHPPCALSRLTSPNPWMGRGRFVNLVARATHRLCGPVRHRLAFPTQYAPPLAPATALAGSPTDGTAGAT